MVGTMVLSRKKNYKKEGVRGNLGFPASRGENGFWNFR